MAFRLLQGPLPQNSLAIFVYHSVTDSPSPLDLRYQLAIPPAAFEFQIRFLAENFHCIHPDRLGDPELPRRAALVTFDDGQRSVFSAAMPILERYGVPCAIFLNAGPIAGEPFWAGILEALCSRRDFLSYLDGQTGPRAPNKPAFLACSRSLVETYLARTGLDPAELAAQTTAPFASTRQLEEWASHPLVCYGNHLYNHDVPRLLSDAALITSYRRNADVLGRFAAYRELFAFPFGEPEDCFTMHQVNLMLQEGAERVFSCSGLFNDTPADRYLHRIQMVPTQRSAATFWAYLTENPSRPV